MSMGLRSFISGNGTAWIDCCGVDDFWLSGAGRRFRRGGRIVTVQGALRANGVTSTNLQLLVSKNACAGNVAQNYFKVTNASTAAVPLSQISIKYWINDTTTPARTSRRRSGTAAVSRRPTERACTR